MRVVDGDSLESDGERLRLWGIDAPELQQTCDRAGRVWPCGRESRNALRTLAREGRFSCVTTGIDKYDRWLVECDLNGRSVNETLVREGWAIAYGGFDRAEAEARNAERGIWSGNFERPSGWRDANRGDAGSSEASYLRVAWMRIKRLVKSVMGP